ncbi:MAG: class II aldolase/adducin family protein [Melioribacter sp.]|nr:class II aldolase/adducin family protein [Melioribacter sp.]
MSLRSDLVEACHKVYAKGFVSAYDGNLSVRTNRKTILITPSGKCKGEISEKDLLEIDYKGMLLKGTGKISTESKLHLLAYQKREDINSVIHCHPVHATALATAGEGMTNPVFPEVILSLGPVHLCKYVTPSTGQLANSILPYIKFAWALLLENHGAVTFGKNIKEAYFRMEKLEHAAHTLIMTRIIGKEKIISSNKLKQLYSIAEKVYGIRANKKNI